MYFTHNDFARVLYAPYFLQGAYKIITTAAQIKYTIPSVTPLSTPLGRPKFPDAESISVQENP
jgi:hypothetical protein